MKQPRAIECLIVVHDDSDVDGGIVIARKTIVLSSSSSVIKPGERISSIICCGESFEISCELEIMEILGWDREDQSLLLKTTPPTFEEFRRFMNLVSEHVGWEILRPVGEIVGPIGGQ